MIFLGFWKRWNEPWWCNDSTVASHVTVAYKPVFKISFLIGIRSLDRAASVVAENTLPPTLYVYGGDLTFRDARYRWMRTILAYTPFRIQRYNRHRIKIVMFWFLLYMVHQLRARYISNSIFISRRYWEALQMVLRTFLYSFIHKK